MEIVLYLLLPQLAHSSFHSVRFEVLAAVNMKITVFWDVMLCNHIGCYQCFGGMLLLSSRTHLP